MHLLMQVIVVCRYALQLTRQHLHLCCKAIWQAVEER
jgi:hypothetical protein